MALPLTLLALALFAVALIILSLNIPVPAERDPIQKSTDEYVWEPCKVCNGTHAVAVKKADLERVQLSK